MRTIGRAAGALGALFRRTRQEQDLDEELRAYLEEAAARHIAAGMTPSEAHRAARVEMGSPEAIKERVRDVGWESLVHALGRDIRFAVRVLGGSPTFTAVAVTTLALGIGATTAIYSVVHAVVLRSLPYTDADRVVRISEEVPGPDGQGPVIRPIGLSKSELDALRASSWTLSHLGTYLPAAVTLGGRERAVRLDGMQLSPSVLAMLGVAPALGRLFEAREENPMDRVMILSHGAWQRHFGADRDVLGRILTLDGTPYTVVGVMPEGFHFPDRQAQFWIPLAFPRGARLVITARLRDGVSMEAAREETARLLQRIRGASAYPPPPPPPPPPTGGGRRMTLEEVMAQPPAHVIRSPMPHASRPAVAAADPPRVRLVRLHDHVVGSSRTALLILMAAGLFVLLIACANITNLLLARNMARRRELATRLALGAGRSRLVRQLLTESAVLATLGGAAGLGLAWAGVRFLRSLGAALPRGGFGPSLGLPRLDEVGVDGAVLAFAFAATAVAGVTAGLLPALHHTRVTAAGDPLREGTGSGSWSALRIRGQRAGGVLVIAQVAMATVLFIGGTLLARSFVKLTSVDPGYDAARVLTFQVVLPHGRPAGTFRDDLTARLATLPQVEAAAFVDQLPMSAGGNVVHLRTSPARPAGPPPPPPPGGSRAPEYPTLRLVSRDYLRVMGTRVVEGRGFSGIAQPGRSREALINQTLARSGYLGAQPIGMHVYLNAPAPLEIIGIVEDVRLFSLDQEAGPQVVVQAGPVRDASGAGTIARAGFGGTGNLPAFLIRTRGDPLAAADGVRAVVADLDNQATVDRLATMDQIVSNTTVRPRLYTLLLGIFAAIAAALALIGIYGVIAYAVRQRTREIGIRMAFGARGSDAVRLVVGQGMLLACTGILAGLAGAVAMARYLEELLYGVSPVDVPTYLVVAGVFAVVGLLAAYLPAHRAARIDPAVTLRCE